MFRKYAKQLTGIGAEPVAGAGAGGGAASIGLLICDEGHRLKSSSADNQTIKALSQVKPARPIYSCS
jgi:hypothetical protein